MSSTGDILSTVRASGTDLDNIWLTRSQWAVAQRHLVSSFDEIELPRFSALLALKHRVNDAVMGQLKVASATPASRWHRSPNSKSPCRRWRCRRRSWRRSRATRKSSTAPAPSSTTTAPTSPSTPTGRWWRLDEVCSYRVVDSSPRPQGDPNTLEAQCLTHVADISPRRYVHELQI